MGSHSAPAIALLLALAAQPAMGQAPGWHYSPLPGEGDRASLGCHREASEIAYTCIAVRCEDDFSTGLHLHSSRPAGAVGLWLVTADREERVIESVADDGPYGARVFDDDGWLLDRLRNGTFIYLRHRDDTGAGYAYIDLGGSYRAIAEALNWCAPRVPETEQNAAPGVSPPNENGADR